MTGKLHVEVRDSLAEVPAVQWNALNTDGNPFLYHQFLHALEDTGCLGKETGWYPRYFLLWEGETEALELIGAVPSYVKTNSYGEFVFDWAWADAYQRHELDYYPKLVSSIPFTPATGRRLLVRADKPFDDTVKLLAGAVRQFADSQEYSGVHFLFVTEAESRILCADSPVSLNPELNPEQGQDDPGGEKSSTALYLQATDHMRRIDCQYHWHNKDYSDFEDFLSLCTSKRRKTIRRERRHVTDAELRLERRHGNTLSVQEWRWVHRFYESTFDRKWGNPSLTEAFFQRMGETFGEHMLIVFAYDRSDEQPQWPVACSIMFIGTDTLYGRFWGCRKEFNSLHFEACYYQGIEFCIENRIRNFEPGAQGEHKITRGFEPTITRSAHYIRHPGFREAIANFLAEETIHMEQRCTGLTDLLPFKAETITL